MWIFLARMFERDSVFPGSHYSVDPGRKIIIISLPSFRKCPHVDMQFFVLGCRHQFIYFKFEEKIMK